MDSSKVARKGKKKGKKGGKKGKSRSGGSSKGGGDAEDSPMVMAIAAMKEHKSFGQMVKYNLSALLLSVTPGCAGWEESCAEFVRLGGMAVLTEIIEIHAKKGNKEILDMATTVLQACSMHPEEKRNFTSKIIKKDGATKIIAACQRVPKLAQSVASIMDVVENCADANGRMMANAEHLTPLIKNFTVFKEDAITTATTVRVIEKILRSNEALVTFAGIGGLEALVGNFTASDGTPVVDAGIVLPSLMAIDRLCMNEANIALYIGADGSFEALLGVIDSMAARPDVLNIAGRLLNKIAGTKLTDYLAQLIAGGLENEERDRIVRIVASLALDPKNATVINRTEGAVSCILALLEESNGVGVDVLPCIPQIVERCAITDDAAWNLIELGTIESLVASMASNEEHNVFHMAACRALSKLATSGRCVAALSEKAGVTEVIATLTRDHEILDVAMAALDFINKVGDVPLMEGELEALIAELVAAEAVQGVLYAIDAEPLEEDGLANADHPPLAAAAMKALTFLGRESPDAHSIIMDGSAVDWAVYNLANEATKLDEAVVEISLALLAMLAEDPETREARDDVVVTLVEKGAVDPVVMALYNHSDHAGIQGAGADVVRLIVSPEAVESMVETLVKAQDAIKDVKHPTEDDIRTVEIPAMALAAFASWNSAAIIEGGGVKGLVDLLKWTTAQRNMPRQEEVMSSCLHALKNLAADRDEESAGTLYEWLSVEGGIAATSSAVKKHPGLKQVAKAGVELMGVLALTPDAHAELISNDAVEAATTALKNNSGSIKLNAAVIEMFDHIVADPIGAKAVCSRGGVKALVDVLRKKAAQPKWIDTSVRAMNQIVNTCSASSACAGELRKQNILAGIISVVKDQPDERVFESGTAAIDALLNDEAVRLTMEDLKSTVDQAAAGELKKLDKLTAVMRVAGYVSTANRFADRIVGLGGPKALVQSIALISAMPETKAGRLECLTAGIEACGLLGGRISAPEYAPAVPGVLSMLKTLRTPACLVCVDRLSLDDANIALVAASGTAAEIIKMIQENGDDIEISRPGFSALATLATHKVGADAIRAANGAAAAREWLNYNLSDEAHEAGAVGALKLLSVLCADELGGAALIAELQESGALNTIMAEVFESARKPTPGLISAALNLAAISGAGKESLEVTFIDTGRLRKLVEMYDAYGRTGDTAMALHGDSRVCKNLARSVIVLHNNLRRAELHQPVEVEGVARLIDELCEALPELAGLVDGKEPKTMLEESLRVLDLRLTEDDDGGAANLDGLFTDLESIVKCLTMEGALDNMNGQWALATFTDTLMKLKEVDADIEDKDPESALVMEGLELLLSWDNTVTATMRKQAGDQYSQLEGDEISISFDAISNIFPVTMSNDDRSAMFDDFKGEDGKLAAADAHELVGALAMPFAGMIQEFAGFFESGGDTSKRMMGLVGKLAVQTPVLHEMARVGTVAEIAARFEVLREEAATRGDTGKRGRRGSISSGAEGNVAQMCMGNVYKSLAPLVPVMRGTEDEVTVVDLLNACPESMHFSCLKSISEVVDGMACVSDIASGLMEGVSRPLELAAMTVLAELMKKDVNSDEPDEPLDPDIFMQMAALAPKMHAAQLENGEEGDSLAFTSMMEALEAQFEVPGFAEELLQKQPMFMASVAAMLSSGDKGQIIVGTRMLAAYAGSIENSADVQLLITPLRETRVLHTLGINITPESNVNYGNATLMNCLDCFCSVASSMEGESAEAWTVMGITAEAYSAMRPTIITFSQAETEEGIAIYEAGAGLLELLEEKHEIEPEFNMDEALKDNFSAITGGQSDDYSCEMGEDGMMMFMDEDGNMLEDAPEEYKSMVAGLESLAACAEMCVGGVAEIAEEQMKSLCECFAKHAGDPVAAMALAKALNKLGENEANLENIAKCGGLEAIIQALIANPERTALLRVLIHLLEKFVRHDAFKEKIGALEGNKALLLCIQKHCEEEFVSGAAMEGDEETEEAVTSVRGDLNNHDVMMSAMLALLANLSYKSRSNVKRIQVEDGVGILLTTMQVYADKPRILEVIMCNYSNWMFCSDQIKLDIGNRCSADIITLVTDLTDDAPFFQMAMRALGNLSTLDENIVTIVNGDAITAIVGTMLGDACQADKTALQIAIQVIGNLAASEDIDLGSGETVPEVIFRQGGAHAVLDTARDLIDDSETVSCALEALNYVCQDGETAKKLNDDGLVDLLVASMSTFRDDVDVIERAFDLFYTLCFAAECAESMANGGALKEAMELMEALASDSPEGILVMGAAALHVLLKGKPKADLEKYATAVHRADGTAVLGRLCEKNLDRHEFISESLETIGRIAAIEKLAHGAAMAFMPSLRKIVLHYLADDGDDAHLMLDQCFKIMGFFAFDSRNIETIVLNSGLPLVLRAVSKYPHEEILMERAIKTIDFIAMGDTEYTKVVIAKGGKAVIEKIVEVYPDSATIQSLGARALVVLQDLEREAETLDDIE
jgi:hypothetical protein